MKTIFILGAGLMQEPAIKAAGEKGYRVVVADGNENASGIPLADGFRHVDLKDSNGLLSAARELALEGDLVAVFTAGTDFSSQVAFLTNRLGLPGPSLEAARNASDKGLMRQAFERAGVPCPRFCVVAAVSEGDNAIAKLGFPLVVKPVDNMGARACRLLRSPEGFSDALGLALENSRSGRAIIEEYVEGPEFSIDSLVSGGEIHICGIADRHVVFEPYFVEMGHTMPSAFPSDVLEEIIRVFKDGVRALGIEDGAAKGDMKLSRDGPRIGEIAARLSGGFMSGWTFPYASGIDLSGAAIDLSCGRKPACLEPRRSWTSAERAWISIPGIVESLLGLSAAEREPYVKNVFPRATAGDSVVFPSNNVEKCGNVISQAPDRSLAVQSAEEAARSILIRLKSDVDATDRFLRGEDRITLSGISPWPPEAFGNPSRAFLSSVDSLPEIPVRVAVFSGGEPHVSVLEAAGWEDETCKDWQGRSLAEALTAARRLEPFSWGNGGSIVLGAEFWKALLRGGYQGAAYRIACAVRRSRERA